VNFLPPISIKGVVFEDGKVWLRLNEFGKWELPGGRIEPGEQPEQTVIRELNEELGLAVAVERFLDVNLWHKDFGTTPDVFLVSYLCKFEQRAGDVEHIGEGGRAEFRAFALDELDGIDLPEPYRHAIDLAIK
jgi:8-oxo-dGTP pyrophosphatase MutT (NUDIX family)